MTERARSGIPWAHELALRLGILVAALVLLCCVGCVSSTPDRGGALERRDIVSTAVAATLTGVAVAQAEPTWTPTPTAIPRGGFRTMPASTATALPTLTPLRWAEEITLQLEIIEDAAQTIASLLGDPLLGDATWTALFAAQVVRMREAIAALRGIVPPEECREAHAMLLSAEGDNLLGAEYVLKGVQQLDPALVEQGNEYMASGAAKMNLFRLMLEAMTP